MNFITTLHRRLEWQLILTYLFIIVVELILIATIGGTPQANMLRAIIFPVAVLLSIYIAKHRVVNPIHRMTEASMNIAAGEYHERLPVYGNIELENLARAFNQMAETLEKTEQHRLQLISDVAHELRTPLSTIKAIMEGLIDNVLVANPDTFLDVQREVSRLQRLVHNLDELSRAEAGQIPVHPQSTVLTDVIETARAGLDFQYEDKAVALEIDVPPNLPRVWADPDCVTQILLNLLGNALQYTPTGGQVTIRARRENQVGVFQLSQKRRRPGGVGGSSPQLTSLSDSTEIHPNQMIVIEIQDTGIGIPADQLPHIFERFYRVDKSRSRAGGGSGIGLTITKHLVKAQNGHIEATSAGLNQGCAFTFTLPLSAGP